MDKMPNGLKCECGMYIPPLVADLGRHFIMAHGASSDVAYVRAYYQIRNYKRQNKTV